MSRRALVWTLAVCAALAAALLLAPRILLRNVTAGAVSELASRSLGLKIRVGSVAVGLGPGLQLSLTDLDFGDAVRADAARLRLALLPLLRGELEVRSVTLESARVEVAALDGGGSGPSAEPRSWPDFVLLDTELVASDTAPRLPPIHLDRLVATGLGSASVGQIDVAGTVGEDAAPFELSGTVGPQAGALSESPLDLALSVKGLEAEELVRWLPESWGLASAAGALDGRITVRGEVAGDSHGELELELPEGSLEWRGTRIDGPARLKSGWSRDASGWSFSDASLDFMAFGGTFRQEGWLALTTPPVFELHTAVAGVRVAELSDEISGDTQLSASGRFAGSWTGGPDWLATIDGSGRVAMKGGSIPGQRIVRALAQSLRSFVPIARAESEPVGRVAQTKLESATASFELAEGVARTDDFLIVTSNFRAHGEGTVGSGLALDVDLLVTLTQAGAGKVLSLALLPARVAGAEAPEIAVHVTGTLRDPEFEPHMPSVGKAALGLIPGILKGAGKSVATGAGRILSRGAEAVRDATPGTEP